MKLGEHKSVQVRILEFADALGWNIVSREVTEQCRDFVSDSDLKNQAKGVSLFFDDLEEVTALVDGLFTLLEKANSHLMTDDKRKSEFKV